MISKIIYPQIKHFRVEEANILKYFYQMNRKLGSVLNCVGFTKYKQF